MTHCYYWKFVGSNRFILPLGILNGKVVSISAALTMHLNPNFSLWCTATNYNVTIFRQAVISFEHQSSFIDFKSDRFAMTCNFLLFFKSIHSLNFGKKNLLFSQSHIFIPPSSKVACRTLAKFSPIFWGKVAHSHIRIPDEVHARDQI